MTYKYFTSNNQGLGSAAEDDAFCYWVNKNKTLRLMVPCLFYNIELIWKNDHAFFLTCLSYTAKLDRHLCTFVCEGQVISTVLLDRVISTVLFIF